MLRCWLVIAMLGACKGESKQELPAPASPPPNPAISDLAGYKAAMAKRFREAENIYDRDGVDCAKLTADLKAMGAVPPALKAFEGAHPDAVQKLDQDEAWGDVVKASATHAGKAMSACVGQTAFMEANAALYE